MFKGAPENAKEAAMAAWGGEKFRQRKSRNATLGQEPPPSLETQDGAKKEAAPTLAVPTERKVPGVDRDMPGKSHLCHPSSPATGSK